ncbi:restriction endonuclease [Actinocorallia aurantiaca]|uniref:Restriction endonuclease type IV Mrr domain-containing protein n=1 Tax=Actinocorallia aurantiaca TaxID=46204 RepID=A0ABN3UJJ6_9ACTN
MTPSFAVRLQRALTSLDDTTTTGQGMRLQNLAHFVLESVPGVTIVAQNTMDAQHSGEIDLWLQHEAKAKLPFIDPLVPVECKNEVRTTSAAQIREFAAKIRYSGGSDGLIITRSGLSGQALTGAHHALQAALHDRIRILVVTCQDLEMMTRAAEIPRLLQDRHIELRMKRTYQSI